MNDWAFGVLDKFVGVRLDDNMVALWYVGNEEAILIGKFGPEVDLASIAMAWQKAEVKEMEVTTQEIDDWKQAFVAEGERRKRTLMALDIVDRLAAENHQLQQEHRWAVSLLRPLEFATPFTGPQFCRCCGNSRWEGHTKTCLLDRFLKLHTGEVLDA